MSTIPPVAKRYAQALLDLGVEQEAFEAYGEQLGALAGAFTQSHDFRSTMLDPSVGLEDRKAIMAQIADKYSMAPMVKNFSLLLLDKDRLRYLEAIASEYQRLADEFAGRVRGVVTSAQPLNTAQVAKLEKNLSRMTGKTVALRQEIDESLLGGVVARVGSVVLDGSVHTQLESMRDAILSASRSSSEVSELVSEEAGAQELKESTGPSVEEE
ncbi:MAG: ATP synthase F1 subunit delta [Myxococcota bacterium]